MTSQEQEILEKIHQARDHYIKQNYEPAIELYTWIENQLQDDLVNLPIIQIELGWSYYNFKDFKNCIIYLKKALQSNSLNTQQIFDCLKLIGFSLAVSGEKKEAITFLEKAIEQEIPEEEKKYVNFKLGEIHFIEGAIKKAKQQLEPIHKYFSWKEPEYYQTLLYYLGFIAFYEKQFERATHYFSEIIQNTPIPKNKASGYFGLAHLSHEKKNFVELKRSCEKILELDKDFYDQETIGYFLCKSLMELKQYKQFLSIYFELHRKYPNGRYSSYYPLFEKTLQKTKPKN